MLYGLLNWITAILEALEIIQPEAPEAEVDASSSEDSEDDDSNEDDNVVDSTERIRQLKVIRPKSIMLTFKSQLRELKRKVKREPEAPPELLDLTQPEVKKRRIVVDLTAEELG